jgi:K+-transporting ATPase ATPase B chain
MKGQNPKQKQSFYTGQLYRDALFEALKKFDPRRMMRNPVMFVAEVVSVLTTGFWVQALIGKGEAPAGPDGRR